MRQLAVKGDIYEIWEDTYSAPETQEPPGPYDPIYKIVGPTDLPDTGEEFVFCNGKPVIFVNYEFSKTVKEEYRREWDPPDEEGEYSSPNEENKSSIEVKVKAKDGNDYVFIDGIPASCIEGGVKAKGEKYALIEDELVVVGTITADGEFTECFGNIFLDD